MKRVVAVLALVALLASSATAVTVWQLTRGHRPQLPEISAYTHGQLVRVGPYKYCDVFDLSSCDIPANAGELGVLEVTQRDRVQLSVPPAIARAPWILLREYEDDTVVEEFRPDTTPAVTIPTYDARLGRLTGIAVQLPTLVRDEQDNEFPWPHAEWSVATVWA